MPDSVFRFRCAGHDPHVGHHRSRIGKNRGMQPLQDQLPPVRQLNSPGIVDIALPQRHKVLEGGGRKKEIEGEGGIHGKAMRAIRGRG